MPVCRRNIGHCDIALFNAISNLNRFEEGAENLRVGGSIPPLATIQSTVRSGDMGNGLFRRHSCPQVVERERIGDCFTRERLLDEAVPV
jgi:hypothetical protein